MTDGLFGSWDAEIATPIGKQSVVFEFARDSAGHVHGDATDRFGVVPMIDVSVSGMRATWTQHVTRPLRLTLRFEVEIDGDLMQGTAKAGVLPTSRVTANRRA